MKLLAAHRAGITHVLVPARNSRDIDDLPDEVKEKLEISLVDHMDDVMSQVFEDKPLRPVSSGDTPQCLEQDCTQSVPA